MKRSLISSLALASLAAAGSAHAQSSVTLYGIVDAGLTYTHNVASGGVNQNSLYSFRSGNFSGSRWGVRGSEDLGGGLAAIFQLENGFNIGTGTLGQGSREFGRKAIVGLTGATWGTVTMGRQYDPSVDLVQPLTADGYFGGTFATPGDLDNYDNSLRVSNSVKYTSPSVAGIQVEAMYAFGGVAGGVGQGQTYGFGATYLNGPIGVAASYLKADAGNTVPAVGLGRTWSGSSDNILTQSSVTAGYATAKSLEVARAAAQYVFGPMTVGAAYSYTQLANDAFSRFTDTQKFQNGSVFVMYQALSALRVGAGYNYTHGTGVTGSKYHQANVGAVYSLSKRTDLYAFAAYQKAIGDTLAANGTAVVAATASVGSTSVSSGKDTQELVSIGIRHKF
jgi:predicted porin